LIIYAGQFQKSVIGYTFGSTGTRRFAFAAEQSTSLYQSEGDALTVKKG
jgi:5-deoxy-D-glucuronate isomerase